MKGLWQPLWNHEEDGEEVAPKQILCEKQRQSDMYVCVDGWTVRWS